MGGGETTKTHESKQDSFKFLRSFPGVQNPPGGCPGFFFFPQAHSFETKGDLITIYKGHLSSSELTTQSFEPWLFNYPMMIVWRTFLLPVVTATEPRASERASRMLESVTAWLLREKVAGLTFEVAMPYWAQYETRAFWEKSTAMPCFSFSDWLNSCHSPDRILLALISIRGRTARHTHDQVSCTIQLCAGQHSSPAAGQLTPLVHLCCPGTVAEHEFSIFFYLQDIIYTLHFKRRNA